MKRSKNLEKILKISNFNEKAQNYCRYLRIGKYFKVCVKRKVIKTKNRKKFRIIRFATLVNTSAYLNGDFI